MIPNFCYGDRGTRFFFFQHRFRGYNNAVIVVTLFLGVCMWVRRREKHFLAKVISVTCKHASFVPLTVEAEKERKGGVERERERERGGEKFWLKSGYVTEWWKNVCCEVWKRKCCTNLVYCDNCTQICVDRTIDYACKYPKVTFTFSVPERRVTLLFLFVWEIFANNTID